MCYNLEIQTLSLPTCLSIGMRLVFWRCIRICTRTQTKHARPRWMRTNSKELIVQHSPHKRTSKRSAGYSQCYQVQILKNPQFSHQKSAYPNMSVRWKLLEMWMRKRQLKDYTKLPYCEKFKNLKNILTFQKCYLALLTFRWYKVKYQLWISFFEKFSWAQNLTFFKFFCLYW